VTGTLLIAAVPLGAFAAVFGGVALWDRLREPHRPLDRPIAVVDARTYRAATRRIERLLATGDADHRMHAIFGTTAVCLWLRREVRTGRRSRRVRRARQLEQWEMTGETLRRETPGWSEQT
jgi:hypothetical protein